MMLNREPIKKVVNSTEANAARDFKGQFLRNARLITVSGDRGNAGLWRLDKRKVGGQTICLQAIPERMSCDDVIKSVKEEVLKEYKNLAYNRGLRGGECCVHYVGRGSYGAAVMNPREPKSAKVLTMMASNANQLRPPSVPSWPAT